MTDKMEVMLSQEEIKKAVEKIAEQINKDYEGKEVFLICILKGSVFFLTDLARCLKMPVVIDFMIASSYGDSSVSSGKVNILKDLEESIEGKEVLIVEDIIDTGTTLYYLRDELMKRNPASLKICTLLDKPSRRVKKQKIDYYGFQIDDKFVVGYGMDYQQKHRNLPYIGIVQE